MMTEAQRWTRRVAGYLAWLALLRREEARAIEQDGGAGMLAKVIAAPNDRLPEPEFGIVADECLQYGRWLFELPGIDKPLDLMECARRASACESFLQSDFGRAWWRAVIWVYGDDLITVTEAAAYAGTSVPNIVQSKRLVFFLQPGPDKKSRPKSLVRLSQVQGIWLSRA